jgi:hypothetical protein
MYNHIVGSLIYMTITRPNLSYAVGVVSQFMQTPRKPHLDAVRRILRYIKHTLQCGIFYEAKSQLQIHGYMDVDLASNVSDRISTSGFMFSFGSGAVSWSSKKQPIVALSNMEVEYRGAIIAACEIIWLQNYSHIWDNQWMLLLSFIVITLVAYYLLTIRSIMLGQSILKCITTLLEKKL